MNGNIVSLLIALGSLAAYTFLTATGVPASGWLLLITVLATLHVLS